MNRPNNMQVAAAIGILAAFTARHGHTASDTVKSKAVYAIHSAMGGPGSVPEEYANAVIENGMPSDMVAPDIFLGEDGSFELTANNPLGLPAGTYTLVADDADDEQPDPFDDGEPNENDTANTATDNGGDPDPENASKEPSEEKSGASEEPGAATDPDPAKAELPDEAALRGMTREGIQKQAKSEGLDLSVEVKDEMVKKLLAHREKAS